MVKILFSRGLIFAHPPSARNFGINFSRILEQMREFARKLIRAKINPNKLHKTEQKKYIITNNKDM